MRVEIRKIDAYQLDDLEAAIAEYLSLARSKRLSKAKKILIKPNCLGAYTPDKAITTHPLVLEALILYLLKLKKHIFLGDSPGGTVNVEQVWEKTGIRDLAERYPIKLVNLSTYKPGSYFGSSGELKLSSIIDDVDGIINVAKYKTHSLTAFTGAVKNLYGLIPGMIKTEYHKQYPDTEGFGKLLSKIHKSLLNKVLYNFIDGIDGMDGAGPAAGSKRHFGLFFGSSSAGAVDAIASKMMGFGIGDIPYLFDVLHNEGILPSKIEVPRSFQGQQISGVNIGVVKQRSSMLRFVPKLASRFLHDFFRYHPIVLANCQKCAICVSSCPVKAISLAPGMIAMINHRLCIKCMCCHEMCPHHAIGVYKSPLARLVLGKDESKAH